MALEREFLEISEGQEGKKDKGRGEEEERDLERQKMIALERKAAQPTRKRRRCTDVVHGLWSGS